MRKVWQEQTRERFISFIEGVLHFRTQYERLQAMAEFKKQTIQLSFRMSDGITLPRLAKVRHRDVPNYYG